jgi:hypothetical protein
MIDDLIVSNPNNTVFLVLDSLSFHGKNCVRVSIGTMYIRELTTLALAHALKLDT